MSAVQVLFNYNKSTPDCGAVFKWSEILVLMKDRRKIPDPTGVLK